MSDLTSELDLTFKSAGNLLSHVTVSARVHRCAHITNGVSIREHDEGKPARGSWIIDFKDLEAWYLAAKAYRDAQGKTGSQP